MGCCTSVGIRHCNGVSTFYHIQKVLWVNVRVIGPIIAPIIGITRRTTGYSQINRAIRNKAVAGIHYNRTQGKCRRLCDRDGSSFGTSVRIRDGYGVGTSNEIRTVL